MLPIRLFNSHTDGTCASPLGGLTRWSREMDGLFDRAFGWTGDTGFRVDVRQDGDDLVVDAELPGLSKEDLEITVEDNVLTIAGEHKSATDEEQEQYHVRERRYGRISRSFSLPTTADAENVTANLQDGVLTLRIPTREEAKPRKIEVK